MKLPELKKKFRNRYAIKIVAGVLTVALLGSSMTAVAVQADQKEDATVETTAETVALVVTGIIMYELENLEGNK